MSEVAQSCPTLCDPMDCSLPHSSIRGIFQAKVLEWVAISFSVTHITTEQIAASQPGVKPLLILALLPSKASLSPSLQPHCRPARLFSLYFTHIHPRKHLRAPTREGRRLWRLRGQALEPACGGLIPALSLLYGSDNMNTSIPEWLRERK